MGKVHQRIGYAPRLITPDEAAGLLGVSTSTVRGWIKRGSIPYLKLPGTEERSTYRIPLDGLISSLSGNYDLAAAIRAADEKVGEAQLTADDLTEIARKAADEY